jgi:hypothetical protein
VPVLVATKDRRSLSPMDIVAALTKVVQEQREHIAEQDRKLQQLADDVEQLKSPGK